MKIEHRPFKAVYTAEKSSADASEKWYGPHNFSRLQLFNLGSDKKSARDEVWEVVQAWLLNNWKLRKDISCRLHTIY